MKHHSLRLGGLIRRARLALDPPLTQEQLAAAVGVRQPSVSAWEGDKCLPELQTLVALTEVLHLDAAAVLDALADSRADEPTAAAG